METTQPNVAEQGWLHPAAGRAEGLAWRGVRALSSLRLTLAVLLALAAGVVLALKGQGPPTWPLLAPLGLLSANLLAAIAIHPAFRRQGALLVFHLALLAIVALVALGRLTYLKGHVELSQGELFTGHLTDHEAGPWHAWGLRAVRFRNEGFTIDYLPGRQRDHTFNRIATVEADGRRREVIIGDQVPLVLDGYRFYTTFNKGFALTFDWLPRQGPPVRGTVHLPAFPTQESRQANTWTPPGAAGELWVQLQFDEALLDPRGAAHFRTPGSHRVVVRTGERRAVLTPGQSLALPDGRLVYQGVGTWMGYKVFYDWTIPWLLAACVVAVASLGWHLWRKCTARPWQLQVGDSVEAP